MSEWNQYEVGGGEVQFSLFIMTQILKIFTSIQLYVLRYIDSIIIDNVGIGKCLFEEREITLI